MSRPQIIYLTSLNDFDNVKTLLEEKEYDDNLYLHAFYLALERGYFDLVKLIYPYIKGKIEFPFNYLVFFAIEGKLDYLQFILEKENIIIHQELNLGSYENEIIQQAYLHLNLDVVRYLWNFEEVTKTLETDAPAVYNLMIKETLSNNINNF